MHVLCRCQVNTTFIMGVISPKTKSLDLRKQVIRVKKTRGAAAPRTRITWASFLGSEEPSLKLLRSAKLQRTNSSPISYCRRLKSAIFLSRNIKL